ncbi:hypothetical protein Areg01_77750, partial [Actinoplanes regularis]
RGRHRERHGAPVTAGR